MKKTITSLLLLCLTCTITQAQNEPVNPFEEFGYTPKIATLSKGKYVEFHDQDSIVQISHGLFNVNTMKLVGFVQYDTSYSEATLEPEVISRWLSPDPLSAEFPSWSPYNYAADNPIFYTDPDGQAVRPVNEGATQVLNTTFASFTGDAKTFTDALLIQPNASGVYTSSLISASGQPYDFKGFKKHLKNKGITLNKTQLIEAFDVFSLVSTSEVFELAVLQKPTAGNTREGGDSGSNLTNDASRSKNANYFDFLGEFRQDPTALDNQTNEQGYGIIPYRNDSGDSNAAIGEKGTIIIDATGNDANQASDKLKEVTTKIP